jgi:hypothetical protein
MVHFGGLSVNWLTMSVFLRKITIFSLILSLSKDKNE